MKINDDRLKQLCAKGLNPSQIAQRLQVSVSGVHQAIKRLNAVAAAESGSSISCSAKSV